MGWNFQTDALLIKCICLNCFKVSALGECRSGFLSYASVAFKLFRSDYCCNKFNVKRLDVKFHAKDSGQGSQGAIQHPERLLHLSRRHGGIVGHLWCWLVYNRKSHVCCNTLAEPHIFTTNMLHFRYHCTLLGHKTRVKTINWIWMYGILIISLWTLH